MHPQIRNFGRLSRMAQFMARAKGGFSIHKMTGKSTLRSDGGRNFELVIVERGTQFGFVREVENDVVGIL